MPLLVTLLILLLCAALPAAAQTGVQIQTRLGNIDVRLYDPNAPQTVANFLSYVDARAYDQSIIHRSAPGFVIQGGGFQTTLAFIPVGPPVPNEPGIPNLRGTIAMAKVAGNPNSATSGWFINLVDNPGLDDPNNNGGFTVFGKVTTDGMRVVDNIALRLIVNFGAGFETFPVMESWAGASPTAFDLVVVQRIARLADGQCGDVNDDRVVDDDDMDFLRQFLAGRANPSADGIDNCPVIASASPCSILDWVVLRRDLVRLGPGIADVCPAQTP